LCFDLLAVEVNILSPPLPSKRCRATIPENMSASGLKQSLIVFFGNAELLK